MVSTRRASEDVDEAVRGAVRTLLAERGYQAMTMELVAARAGVAKTAVYRRWPSKAEMVFDVVVHGAAPAPPVDTGWLAGDLRGLVEHVLTLLGAPPVRGAMPGLIADLRSDPDLAGRFRTTVIDAEREVVAAIVRRARRRKEITGAVRTEHLHAQLLGTVFAWLYLLGDEPPADLAKHITAALIAAAQTTTRPRKATR